MMPMELLSPLRRHRRSTSQPLRAISAALCLIGFAMVCEPAAATSRPAPSLNQIALQQWSETLKEQGLDPAPIPEPALDSLVEEAGKQAQAEYLAKKLRRSPEKIRKFIDLAWAEASRRDGLTPELLIAIIHTESALKPQARSRAGALGLMQVIPRWHREKFKPSESLFDPHVNVRVGTDVLEEYLEEAGGNLHGALKKYSGNTPGYARKVLNESDRLARVAEQAATSIALNQG